MIESGSNSKASKKALATASKKAKDVEVLPALTKAEKKVAEEIIEETDTLSPRIKNMDLDNLQSKDSMLAKLEKQKGLLNFFNFHVLLILS